MKIRKWLYMVLFGVVLFFFIFAGRFLVVSEKPVHSDVIIVLGGGYGERTLKASQLFKRGFAPYVMDSNGGTRFDASTSRGQLEIQWLQQDGVPKQAIIPELQAQSTYGNAVYTEKLMKQHHFKSAIVVSSSYHMRRAQYIFNKIYKGSDITLHYVAAPAPHFHPNWWWTTWTGWNVTISEYIKLVIYLIVYGIF